MGEFVAFGFIAVAASESDLDANVVGALAAAALFNCYGIPVDDVIFTQP